MDSREGRPMIKKGETMGQRLQRLRQAAGFSQPRLAAAAAVRVSSLRNWEQGRRLPQLDAAARLAKALGITLGELAGGILEGPPAAQASPGAKKRHGGKGKESEK